MKRDYIFLDGGVCIWKSNLEQMECNLSSIFKGNFAQRHCTNVQFAVEHRQLENWPSTIMKLRFFAVTHCGHYLIHFLYSQREVVRKMTFLPFFNL